MSDKLIKVDVVSQKGSIYSADAKMVNLRGDEGEMGISYGHTQLLSTLPAGVVRIEREGEQDTLFVSGGIVEVQPHQVIILADVMERAKDLNEAAAEKARQQAEEALNKAKGESKVDAEEARRMLSEAEARLKALKILKGVNAYYSDSDH
ncbi:F0F1 ATP synthase subunit epsilon [Fangia hongkongensis]|uniref:F0F1 ATP synthase subunit epsilon n=1 Tax=Fangia hongkongensis TaxID=270495 RepID=UPI000373C1FF|nr:F0F1 ATP synthase subunit epsilon [Fangia hongkongensis]MBK2125698.1 F0F1 ATP synthase subunit epsilon [Fangia hongkongensis]